MKASHGHVKIAGGMHDFTELPLGHALLKFSRGRTMA
jgi:hypothetical protein